MTTLEYIIGARRYLHRHPELSLEEHETSAWLRKQLEELGYKPFPLPIQGCMQIIWYRPKSHGFCSVQISTHCR